MGGKFLKLLLGCLLLMVVSVGSGEEQSGHIRLPNRARGELFGYIEQLLGAYRMRVRCEDGLVRLCKVPGGKRKSIWVQVGDLVIVEPWPLEGDKKGNVVYKYPKGRVEYLRGRGFLKRLDSLGEGDEGL